MGYTGRFAPSPTGPLHLGSLTTAIASYLHARQGAGTWLVRIEDIDPPREPAGAAASILRVLEAYGLLWDGPVLYQRSRLTEHRRVAEALLASGKAFPCSCSRRDVADQTSAPGRYPGTCRARETHAGPTSLRVRVEDGDTRFEDGLQGPISANVSATTGDYVILRRGGLPAYHLAVVLDDAWQGVTTVVRGADLLAVTPIHLHLQRLLGLPQPNYFHLPVVVDSAGHKLSKQTGASPVESEWSAPVLRRALGLLGLSPPAGLIEAGPEALWPWAIANWRIAELFGRQRIHSS